MTSFNSTDASNVESTALPDEGLSNGGAGEPQCLMSTDAGEETDDFGDSGDATECAEDVEDPEGIPKTLEAASTSAINLQQTVPALAAATNANNNTTTSKAKSRKRRSSEQNVSEKQPKSNKSSAKNRRKNIRNLLKTNELNEDTLAALQAEKERLKRSAQGVSSDLNRLLFGADHSENNRDSSEAGSSSAPKKQKTEPNETAAALKSQAIKLEVTESVEDTSKIPSRPDAPDTGNLNGALNIGSLPNDAVKSERSELAKPDLVFLSDDEDEICADGKSVNNFRHDPSRDLDISDNEADDEDEGDDVICIDQSPGSGATADEDYDEETDAEYDDSTLDDSSLSSLTTTSKQVLVNVAHPVGDPDVLLSPKISEKIKPHQVQGIRFLYSNIVENFARFEKSQGFGCILGHSMGLGKTLQVVAFSELFFEYKLCNKILIIVPINTVQNWINEFGMWTDAEIFDWNKHKVEKAQKLLSLNSSVANSPGAERHVQDSGLVSPTHSTLDPGITAQLHERYDRIARLVCDSPPNVENFEILSEMCNNFREISFNTNSTQPIQSQISQLFREPSETTSNCDNSSNGVFPGPQISSTITSEVPKTDEKKDEEAEDSDDYQIGFDMLDFENMEDFPTQNLDSNVNENDSPVATTGAANIVTDAANIGEAAQSRRACELQIKQELEQIARIETSENHFTVQQLAMAPLTTTPVEESMPVLDPSLTGGNRQMLPTPGLNHPQVEPMETDSSQDFAVEKQEINDDVQTQNLNAVTSPAHIQNSSSISETNSPKTGAVNVLDPFKDVPMEVSDTVKKETTETENVSSGFENITSSKTDTSIDETGSEKSDSTKKASLFTVYRIPDDCKLNKDRMEIVDMWYNSGGVLLMGYEMFRLLSKLKSTSLTSSKSLKGANVAELRRKQEENEVLVEKLHNQLLSPGGPDVIIADEGHRIKNNDSAIAKCLKALRTKRRVVLTGYPLQNNLMEYWCMVDFVRPNYLGSKQEFSNMFERPISNGQCADSTAKDIKLMKYRSHVLTSLLKGFVLRRSHSVLIKALPKKTEFIVCVRMSPIQKELYRSYLNHIATPPSPTPTFSQPHNPNSNAPSPSSSIEPSSLANPIRAFASLCKIWNHPDVLYQSIKQQQMQSSGRNGAENSQGDELLDFDQSFSSGSIDYSWAQTLMSQYRPGNINDGPKLLILLEIIRMSIQKKEKVLVFSQSLGTLTLIEECLAKCTVPNTAQIWRKNVHYFRLDGDTSPSERGDMINKFNRDTPTTTSSSSENMGGCTPWLFLLSTKAGCLGINLVGASRVVIMDVCWNPCHDAQAVCRVFRYGQTKPTFVYRLVANNTMEKRMYDRQVSKQGMSQRIVDELNPQIFLTKNEVETLLDYREETDIVDHTVSLNRYNDHLLQEICSLYYPMIAKSPFEHESLLVSNETKLSVAEKREAREGYQRDRQRELLGASGVPASSFSSSFFEKTHLNTMASMLLARSGNRNNRRFREGADVVGPPSETLLSLLIRNKTGAEGGSGNRRNMGPIPGEIFHPRGPKPIANIRPFSVRQPPQFNSNSPNSNNYVQSTNLGNHPWANAATAAVGVNAGPGGSMGANAHPLAEGMNNEIEFILASDVRIPGERTYSGHDMILSTGERVTLSSSGNSFYLKAANGSVFQMNASTAGSLLNACSSSCNANSNSFGGAATAQQSSSFTYNHHSNNSRNHSNVQNMQQHGPAAGSSNMSRPLGAISPVVHQPSSPYLAPQPPLLPPWNSVNTIPSPSSNQQHHRRIQPSPLAASSSRFQPGPPNEATTTSSEVIELSDSSEETE